MPIEWMRHLNGQIRALFLDFCNQVWKVSFQVKSHSKEVWNDQDPVRSP